MGSSLIYGQCNSCWVQEELRERGQFQMYAVDGGGTRVEMKETEMVGKIPQKEGCRKDTDGAATLVGEAPCKSSNYIKLLKACAKQKNLLEGSRIHADIVKCGLFGRDAFVSNTLVSMYAKCGALLKGQEVFEELPVRNLVSWTALVVGYAEYGENEEAFKCFEYMQQDGISPDTVSFACILKACGGIRAAERGQVIHAQIIKVGFFQQDILVGTSLVDMYAKCGMLERAQQVFDELRATNVVSWNALISGYVQQELNEEAVVRFEQMQEEGVSPDVVTFACILKACGSARTSSQGFKIHSLIVEDGGLEKDIVVGTGLIDMYAKFGLLSSAHDVFDELPVRNLVSWNALIAGHMQHEQGEEAWICFARMLCEGLSPDAVTFTCLLKACGSSGMLNRGRHIHAQVVKNGLLGVDVVVGTALLDMYAKCGALGKAQEVFDELPLQNRVSWNALIAAYSQHGHGEKALSCYEPMLLAGFSPSAATFVGTMRACALTGSLDRGQQIHANGVKEGFLDDDIVASNALLDMYVKCGALEKSQEVFGELRGRNEVSWSVMIAGYAWHGHGEEALECFKRMQGEGVCPDAFLYACMLKVCCGLRAAEIGQRLHAQIVGDKSLREGTDVANALVEMYAGCGLFESAHMELCEQDVASWNSLLGGYIQHGYDEKALECFEQMQYNSISPDASTFVCILKACGNVRDLDKGETVHLQLSELRLLGNDTVIASAVMDMYIKCGSLSRAQRFFDKLSVRNVVLWTVLMEGYVELGLGEEAVNLFELMQSEGLVPDAVTFLCYLKACGMIGAVYKGLELHAKMVKDWLIKENLAVGSALVDMYVKCGMLEEAQQVFDELQGRDMVLWNVLTAGYAQSGKDQAVFNLLDRMLGEGKHPDVVTFTIFLNTCSHKGLVQKGQTLFESLSADYGITPTLEHHTCIIDLLCRAGHLDKVITMIKEMSFLVNLTIWHILMSACQRWGNIVLGRRAFEQALVLDENSAAIFVCMSSLFAE